MAMRFVVADKAPSLIPIPSPRGLPYAHKFAIHCVARGRVPALDVLFMYPVIPARSLPSSGVIGGGNP
jgi:hypothetical protein